MQLCELIVHLLGEEVRQDERILRLLKISTELRILCEIARRVDLRRALREGRILPWAVLDTLSSREMETV